MTRPLVLVVDDDAGMRETLVEILEAAGVDSQSAADGEAAITMLGKTRYDVVVMDVRLPGRDGVSILEEIGQPPPVVILMTAYALEERLHAAVNAHAYALLQKPFAPPYLIQLIEEAASAA
jgi:CheY-like chemotaxis protein